MKSNILTISDGNGVDTNFKKWPFYLQLLTSNYAKVINRSVIGASNELMFMQLSEVVAANKPDYCIIQWSIPNRIDLVADKFWLAQAEQDPVYNFNVVENNGKTWWVTSASDNEYVKEYHNRYIGTWQAQQRSQAWIIAAAELLKFHKIKFVFSLCYALDFIEPHTDILNSYPWIWHNDNLGLDDFRTISQFSSYDKGLAQPHTLIHLDWINQVLEPNCEFVNYNKDLYNNLEQALIKSCSK